MIALSFQRICDRGVTCAHIGLGATLPEYESNTSVTRDTLSIPPAAKTDQAGLIHLGWQPFFAQQTDIETLNETPPVRVTEVHRNRLRVKGDDIDMLIPWGPDATVGDWLLLNKDLPTASQVLRRKSLIKRRAPGSDRQVQLIAANIDTAFIVTSCNQDFNVARLERYIALAFEAEVLPVIILTKADLCEDPDMYVQQARAISPDVPVVLLDARSDETASALAPWCKPADTVAFLGSSGVGKSTLANALSDTLAIETQAIREDDSKGRHTTTRRQLYSLANGCAVIDTPGMRELQLADAAAGIEELFADLHDLSKQCKFRDCRHDSEPGCALRAAVARGEIGQARFARWEKLMAEDRFNSASLIERKAIGKSLGKTIKQMKKHLRS